MKFASILCFIHFTIQCIIETIHIKGVFIMSSVKTKNLTPLYAFIQGLYWMNFAAIMGYSGFYLLGSGFSNTEIGIIIAIAGILSAVLQPVLAGYADRPESPSLIKFLQLLLVLQLILGISLLFCKSILLTGVVYGCGVTLLQLLMFMQTRIIFLKHLSQ